MKEREGKKVVYIRQFNKTGWRSGRVRFGNNILWDWHTHRFLCELCVSFRIRRSFSMMVMDGAMYTTWLLDFCGLE